MMQFFGSLIRLLAVSAILLLPACASNNNAAVVSSATPGSVTKTETVSPQPGNPSANQPFPTKLSSATQPTVGMETPATPEGNWQDAPVMPDVSQHTLQIYRDGQAQGRDPHTFSVIGDCQSVPFVFLGPFAIGELKPDSAENFLWDAIYQFEDSFGRSSVTSRGGFTAASILNPLQADPNYCRAGETPLTCEYRLNNPSFVFITLETWLDPDTIDRYEIYLRQILDYVTGQGSVPILLTKADSAELSSGTPVINPIIVRLAHEYDVPVVNFWRSAQYLPDRGIDPSRGTFHLTQEGYNVKNILALRALYKVWQAVEQEDTSGSPGSVTPTPAPSQQAFSNPETSPQITVPDCTGGCVFFAAAVSHADAVTSQGVFAYAYRDKKLISVLGEGFDLQDVSEDGLRLLVNKSNYLYEIDLATASSTLISESFFFLGQQDAYWNSNDSLPIFIDQNLPLQTGMSDAFNLFPSSRDEERYFESGTCTFKDYCQSNGAYRLDADQATARLDSFSNLVFSPDGKYVAFLNPSAATKENYYHISYLLLEEPDRGIISRRVFYFPEEHGFMVYPDVREFAFSPDGTRLFIIYDVYSAYFERSLRIIIYMLDITTGYLYDYGQIESTSGSYIPKLVSLTSRLVWSSQGDKALFFLTDVNSDNLYSLNIFQAELNSDRILVPYDQGILTNGDYFYITNIYWR